LPERFRGGCAFGAGLEAGLSRRVRLNRHDRRAVVSQVNEGSGRPRPPERGDHPGKSHFV
jgi:hypothetical protein